MIDESEIIQMADMMHLELDDQKGMVDDIRRILEYFDVLDSAGVDDEHISDNAISIKMLRADKSTEAERNIDTYGDRDSDGYLMAPKVG